MLTNYSHRQPFNTLQSLNAFVRIPATVSVAGIRIRINSRTTLCQEDTHKIKTLLAITAMLLELQMFLLCTSV